MILKPRGNHLVQYLKQEREFGGYCCSWQELLDPDKCDLKGRCNGTSMKGKLMYELGRVVGMGSGARVQGLIFLRISSVPVKRSRDGKLPDERVDDRRRRRGRTVHHREDVVDLGSEKVK